MPALMALGHRHYREADRGMGSSLNSTLKFLLATAAALLCLGVAFFEYSTDKDQQRFHAAKNQCERECIQDSGGLNFCRNICAQHPDRYP